MRLSLGLFAALAVLCLTTTASEAATHWSHTYHLKKGRRLHLTFTGHKGRALVVAACGGPHFRKPIKFPNSKSNASFHVPTGGVDGQGRPHTCVIYVAVRAYPGGTYRVTGLPKGG
jgi:hypothetical protein